MLNATERGSPAAPGKQLHGLHRAGQENTEVRRGSESRQRLNSERLACEGESFWALAQEVFLLFVSR